MVSKSYLITTVKSFFFKTSNFFFKIEWQFFCFQNFITEGSRYKRSVNFEMSLWCHHFDQISNENIVRISALLMILHIKSIESPKKLQRSPQEAKKFQGRNPYNIFVAILVETMTPKRHFEINWPLPASA